jgi:type IV fimbrial biogenesis protein FimT
MSSNHLARLPGRLAASCLRRGLTMIEMLCAVCILATTLGIATPSMNGWQLHQALLANAAELETDIQYARSTAVSRQQTVRLETQALGSSTCYVMHTGNARECTCSGNGQAQCIGNAQVLRVVEHRSDGSIKLSAVGVSMAFDSQRGTVSPTATLELADSQGRSIRQVVNIMGRVRSCSPQGKSTGMTLC